MPPPFVGREAVARMEGTGDAPCLPANSIREHTQLFVPVLTQMIISIMQQKHAS